MRFFGQGKLLAVSVLMLLTMLLVAACATSAPANPAPESSSAAAVEVGSSEESRQSQLGVSLADDRLVPETIQVKHGDLVTLNLETDRPGTFHIHGYDLQQEAVVGEVTEFQFEANATGRFRINFHGVAKPQSSTSHGPMESAAPVDIDVSATAADGGVHVKIDTDGWRWAPEQVNGQNIDGEGHAHVYAGDVKLSRVYGPHHFIPNLEAGDHQVRVSLNTNDHSELTWNGELLEASATVTVPEMAAVSHPGQGPEPAPMVSSTPMSLEAVAHEDSLGGYNLQVKPQGFQFSNSMEGAGESPMGYALLSINGEVFNRLYVPWLQVPAQGAGMLTFTVALMNDEGLPYHYDGQPVEVSVQVHEQPKTEAKGAAATGHHDGSSARQATGGPQGSGPDAAAASDHHSGGSGGSAGHHGDGATAGAADIVELEVGYLEVLP